MTRLDRGRRAASLGVGGDCRRRKAAGGEERDLSDEIVEESKSLKAEEPKSRRWKESERANIY